MQDRWPPPGSPGWPPPSLPANGHSHGPDPLWMLLGRLDERTMMIQQDLDQGFRRIDGRLDEGQQLMREHDQDIAVLKAAPQKQADPLPGWEIAIKRPVPWIIAVAALAVTGKLEVAVRLVEALGKIAEAAN